MFEQLQESSLQLLRGGARDLPDRHQTLRRAVRWSYDLLTNGEQRALRLLSVFVGGCALEEAMAMLGSQDAIDMLDSLVSKSLLHQTEASGASRFTMLEVIREFGWEQLVKTAELPSARRAHANIYLSFAEEATQGLSGAERKAWLFQLDQERDNLRAALQWAIDQHEAEVAQRLAGALQPFWFARGYWSEGRRWLEASLGIDSGDKVNQAVRARALYGEAKLARFQGDFAYARILCEQSLVLYRDLNDQNGVLKDLVQLCRITAFQHDQAATESYLAEAAAMIVTLPDSVVKANAYTDMAIALVGTDKFQSPVDVTRYLAESERIHRAHHNQSGLAFTLIHLANQARDEGNYSLSTARYDEAEHILSELGDSHLLFRMALSRIFLDIALGDFSAARHRADISLQEGLKRSDHHLIIGVPLMATILHGQGQPVWAARVLGLTEAMLLTPEQRKEAALYEQYLQTHRTREAVRAQLGDEAYAREMAAGRRLKLEDLLTIPHPPESTSPVEAAPSAASAGLTARESEVLSLLAEELSNPQIAERLVVSRRTVDAHLRSIYDKLGVRSRDAAVRVAREQGLLEH
jgi:non-specific serine/threonine protein kinase